MLTLANLHLASMLAISTSSVPLGGRLGCLPGTGSEDVLNYMLLSGLALKLLLVLEHVTRMLNLNLPVLMEEIRTVRFYMRLCVPSCRTDRTLGPVGPLVVSRLWPIFLTLKGAKVTLSVSLYPERLELVALATPSGLEGLYVRVCLVNEAMVLGSIHFRLRLTGSMLLLLLMDVVGTVFTALCSMLMVLLAVVCVLTTWRTALLSVVRTLAEFLLMTYRHEGVF